MNDERFFYNENSRSLFRVWIPAPSTKGNHSGTHIKGLSRKTRAIKVLLRGRPGRRPVSAGLYLEHKEYIWTAWSRLNLEAATGSAALTWTCKHVALFRFATGLSRLHFLSPDAFIEPPDPPSLIARMLFSLSQRADAYLSELKKNSGILLIHFGEKASENQCRYTP